MSFFRSLTAFNDLGAYGDFMSDTPQYVPVSNLKNSDVFTAINVIANDIATNPIKLESDNVNHITDNHFSDLNYLLNIKPNDQMTARDFKYSLTANLLLTGNAYARIYRDPLTKKPIDMEVLRPSWVTVFVDEKTGLVKYTIQDTVHSPYDLRQEDVLHIKFLTTNGLVGASPLYALKDEVKLQKQGNHMLSSFFASGINGSSILKMPGHVGPDARDAVRREWLKANAGDKTHRVMILANGEDYEKVDVDTSILKIVNSNDYTTKQIAKAFGIPVSRLGLENAHTSLPQSNLDYIQNSLDHYFNRFTAELNIKLLTYQQSRKYHFEFDVSRLMELDTETNMKQTLEWYKSGLLDDNEARQRLGYPPHEDAMAGTRIVMSNFVPIENIRENYPNNVAVGNKYDDTGKPIEMEKLSGSNRTNVLEGEKETEGGTNNNGDQKPIDNANDQPGNKKNRGDSSSVQPKK